MSETDRPKCSKVSETNKSLCKTITGPPVKHSFTFLRRVGKQMSNIRHTPIQVKKDRVIQST